MPYESVLLKDYTPRVFSEHVSALASAARPAESITVVPSKYVLVITVEVGQDKALDSTRIELVEEGVTGRRTSELVSWRRMFHEHGLLLGAAHAMRIGADVLMYARDRTYVWE
jgi:hypothetical protein